MTVAILLDSHVVIGRTIPVSELEATSAVEETSLLPFFNNYSRPVTKEVSTSAQIPPLRRRPQGSCKKGSVGSPAR